MCSTSRRSGRRQQLDNVTGAGSATSSITAADGTPLLVRRWTAAIDPWAVDAAGPRPGRALRALRTRGLRCWPRPGSMSRRSICAVTADRAVAGGTSSSWTDYLDDIAARLEAVRAEADGRPVVLFAHSYGGLICTDYVLSGRPVPDVLVLSAPALGDGLPRWQHILAPLIARIWPTLALKNAWGPDVLSRDPEVGRLVGLDPGNPERMTVRLGAFGFAAQERVRAIAVEAGRADARVPWLGRSPRATQRRPSRSKGCRASPGACIRGFGTRRSTSRRVRRSSPTSSPGCARRWSDGRPSRPR